jgi:hypothetical protein
MQEPLKVKDLESKLEKLDLDLDQSRLKNTVNAVDVGNINIRYKGQIEPYAYLLDGKLYVECHTALTRYDEYSNWRGKTKQKKKWQIGTLAQALAESRPKYLIKEGNLVTDINDVSSYRGHLMSQHKALKEPLLEAVFAPIEKYILDQATAAQQQLSLIL